MKQHDITDNATNNKNTTANAITNVCPMCTANNNKWTTTIDTNNFNVVSV